jgi:hypothetical protein
MATITITSHVIKFANRIIQISNISEASLWIDKTKRRKAIKWILFGIAILVGCLFASSRFGPEAKPITGVGLIIGVVVIGISGFCLKPLYGLLLHTSSGRVVPLASKDHGLMQRVLSEIQDAMTHRDPDKNVTINVGNAIMNSSVLNSQIGSNIAGDVNAGVR